jgi:hypothetical protein
MELSDWLAVENMADSQQNPFFRQAGTAPHLPMQGRLKLNRAVIMDHFAGQMWVIT